MTVAEKLTTVAENQQKVYDAGYAAGQTAGGGGTGEDFWDVFQENGTRTNYEQCFNGDWWTQGRFNPKYPIVIQRCNYMFQQSAITDLSGVTIDFSKKTDNTYSTRPFDQSDIVTIGTIDLSNIDGILNTIFAFQIATDVYLETIQKLILSDTNTFGANFFQNCVKLKNITIEGTIGNDLNMSACPLTTESVQSVIEHLKDLTGQTSKRLQLSSTVAANLTPAQSDMLTAKNWTT